MVFSSDALRLRLSPVSSCAGPITTASLSVVDTCLDSLTNKDMRCVFFFTAQSKKAYVVRDRFWFWDLPVMRWMALSGRDKSRHLRLFCPLPPTVTSWNAVLAYHATGWHMARRLCSNALSHELRAPITPLTTLARNLD